MWGSKKEKNKSQALVKSDIKPVKMKSKDQQPTLISGNAVVKGDIGFSGQLFIHGSVVGNINATELDDGALTVSEQGDIKGDIHAPVIVINGTVVGDIYAYKQIELQNKANVIGNIYYNVIEMAKGARVNGSLVQQDVDTVLDPDKTHSRSATATVKQARLENIKPSSDTATDSLDTAKSN